MRLASTIRPVGDWLAGLFGLRVCDALRHEFESEARSAVDIALEAIARGELARWGELRQLLARAGWSGETMRHDPSLQARDAATVTYVDTVDRIVEVLAALERDGALAAAEFDARARAGLGSET